MPDSTTTLTTKFVADSTEFASGADRVVSSSQKAEDAIKGIASGADSLHDIGTGAVDASESLRGIDASAQQASDSMKMLGEASTSENEIADRSQQVVKALEGVDAEAKSVADSLKNVSASANSGGGITTMTGSMQAFGSTLVDVTSSALGFIATAQMLVQVLQQVAAPALDAQQNLQQMSDSMGGDVQVAHDLQDQLEKLAEALGLPTDGVEAVGQKLLAMGTDASNVAPEIAAIGEAVDALGGGTDKMSAIATSLEKIQSEGKVTAQSMTRLQDTGVQAWQALADGLGITVPEAEKKVADGAITAAQATTAIVKGMDDLYKGQQSAGDFTKQWQSFTDILGKVATIIVGPVVAGLTDLLTLINGAAVGITNFGDALAHAFGQKGGTNPADGTAQLATAMNKLDGVTDSTTQTAQQFNAATNDLTRTTGAAATSVGNLSTATGTATKALDIGATYMANMRAQKAALSDAANKTATSLGDVVPGSLQDQLDTAGQHAGTLQAHFTDLSTWSSAKTVDNIKAIGDAANQSDNFLQQLWQSITRVGSAASMGNGVDLQIPHYAGGGTNISGWGITSEDGPELINFGSGGGTVVPINGNGTSISSLAGSGSSNNGPVTFQVFLDGKMLTQMIAPNLAPVMRAYMSGSH